MTTIAWDGESLAADKNIYSDNSLCGKEKKIFKSGKDWITGTGNVEDIQAFMEWYKHGEKKPKITDDFQGVVLREDGRIFEYEGGLYAVEIKTPTAWGSGWEFALASMDHGCNAKEAIKYATKRNVFTGGGVQVVKC